MTQENKDYVKKLNLKKVIDIVLNYTTFVLSGEVENKNHKKIICKFYTEYNHDEEVQEFHIEIYSKKNRKFLYTNSVCGAVSMVSDLIDQLVNVEFFGDY